MPDYWGRTAGLSILVEILLLLGTNRLCGYPSGILRILLAAMIGGLYAGACMLPGFQFLGSSLWRAVSLVLIGLAAFGFSQSALRRGAVFVLLHMALGGAAQAMEGSRPISVLVGAGGILALCLLAVCGSIGGRQLIPVELCYAGKHLRLTALRDTGNTLRDPVTGSSVLVVGADAASKLTGLTAQQLKNPVQTMGAIPGLRLIPYRCVGRDGGFLLALKIPQVKIGSWQGSALVAFAPEGLGTGTEYQALTGGTA